MLLDFRRLLVGQADQLPQLVPMVQLVLVVRVDPEVQYFQYLLSDQLVLQIQVDQPVPTNLSDQMAQGCLSLLCFPVTLWYQDHLVDQSHLGLQVVQVALYFRRFPADH